MREALAYACASGDGERALMLAGTIWRFWLSRGQIAEALQWYGRAFGVGRDASPAARARALYGQSEMERARGELARARIHYEEAAALFRGTDETRWLILALSHAGNCLQLVDPRRAENLYQEALALASETNDRRNSAMVTANLAYLHLLKDDNDRAAALFEQALEVDRAIGDVYGIAVGLENLAIVAFRRGNLETAAARLHEGLQLSNSIGDVHTLVQTLSIAAVVTFARDDTHASAHLGAAAEALCKAHGFELDTIERELMDATVSAVRSALADRFEEEWAAGAKLDLAAAAELALRSLG